MTRSEVSPWAIRGLYLFALVLAASPLMDLVSTVWPMRPSELPWRYGFLGLTAGYLHTPILGMVLGLAVAHWSQNGMLMRGLGALMMASAAVLVLVMGLFMLDMLQIRGMREAEVQSAVLGFLPMLSIYACFWPPTRPPLLQVPGW